MKRTFLAVVFLAVTAVTRAANFPQYFTQTNWVTTEWVIQSPTYAETTEVFNQITNQELLIYLTNVPVGATLTFDWSVFEGVNGQVLQLRKNSVGTALATITIGAQTSVVVSLETGTYYLEFKYTRTSSNGGPSIATLENVVLNLPPQVVVGTLAAIPSTSSVLVEWTSDEESKGRLLFGNTTALGQVTPLEGSFATNHSIMVSTWPASTPLYYRIANTDAQGQVSTNSLLRSFSIPNLSIAKSAPGTVKLGWISDAGQWLLVESPESGGTFNAVTNAPMNSGITNSVVVPASSPKSFFKLMRSSTPGYVTVGP